MVNVGIAIGSFLAPVVPPQVEARTSDTGTEAKQKPALLTCVRDEGCLVAEGRFGKPPHSAGTTNPTAFWLSQQSTTPRTPV